MVHGAKALCVGVECALCLGVECGVLGVTEGWRKGRQRARNGGTRRRGSGAVQCSADRSNSSSSSSSAQWSGEERAWCMQGASRGPGLQVWYWPAVGQAGGGERR